MNGTRIDELFDLLLQARFQNVFRPPDIDLVNAALVSAGNIDDPGQVKDDIPFRDVAEQESEIQHVSVADIHALAREHAHVLVRQRKDRNGPVPREQQAVHQIVSQVPRGTRNDVMFHGNPPFVSPENCPLPKKKQLSFLLLLLYHRNEAANP